MGLGALGVVFGKNAGTFLAFAYLYLTLFKKLELEFDRKSYTSGILIGILILALTLFTSIIEAQLQYLVPVFALVVYLLLMKLFKPIDSDDIKIFREALSSKFGRIIDLIEDLLVR